MFCDYVNSAVTVHCRPVNKPFVVFVFLLIHAVYDCLSLVFLIHSPSLSFVFTDAGDSESKFFGKQGCAEVL